ncbi:MAG TPA: MFS transporter, partial [Rhodanobacteraceae bacterium]
MRQRAYPPVWLIGLTNLTVGMYVGMLIVTLPEVLAARHVPEATIATLTAGVAFSPSFWAFLVCPMLDVRFTRRRYAVAGAVACAVCLTAALLNLQHLVLLAALLLAGMFAAVVGANALGGWFASVVVRRDKSTLSAWMTIANFVGNGLSAVIAGALIAHLGPRAAAPLLGLMVLLPVAIYPFIPVHAPDPQLARASFGRFFSEIARLFRRREVLIALALFVLPSGSFALTNVLGGLGDAFHASLATVSIASGIGMTAGGLAGSLSLPLLARHLPLRPLYLGIGIAGGLFTLGLLLLPHAPATFAVAIVGENVFESLALTAILAISFETIGQGNPLAATIYSVLNAASTLPVDYMAAIDGHAFQWRGLPGAFGVDALAGIGSCL